MVLHFCFGLPSGRARINGNWTSLLPEAVERPYLIILS